MHRFQSLPLLFKFASVAARNGQCSQVTLKLIGAPMLRRAVHASTIHGVSGGVVVKEKITTRIYDFFEYHMSRKYHHRRRGYMLYRRAIDRIDYVKFFNDFKMPDTYYSWFLITELHVWMLMVRTMSAGRDGVGLRNNLVGAMWQDADERRKKLGAKQVKIINANFKEMQAQFNAAVLGYDEGANNNDQVLAGALWRRFLMSSCNDAETLEKLLAYVRKSLNMLDNMPTTSIIQSFDVYWPDYQERSDG